MGKKWMILICFFCVLTFISSITTTILLFNIENHHDEIKTTGIKGSNKNYQNTFITFNGENNIKIDNIFPGNRIEKSFSITNNNSDSIRYGISWQNITTSLTEENENFYYLLKCDDLSTPIIAMPISNATIANNLELKGNHTNNCTITIEVGNDMPLDNNFNASYIIKIDEGGASEWKIKI